MRAAIVMFAAGCFGAGPQPGEATQADVVFALELGPLHEDNCRLHEHIGNVALGDELGYVVTHAYMPGCGGGGPGGLRMPSRVLKFPKRGGEAVKIGEAGETQDGGGPRPRVGARGTLAVWMFTVDGQPGFQIASENNAISGIGGTMGSNSLAGIAVDDTRTFVATWPGPQGTVVMSPRYPCCGSGGNPPPSSGFFAVTNANPTASTAMPVTPIWFGDQIKEPLVANSSTLFYVQRSTTGQPNGAIMSLPKSGTTASMIAPLGSPDSFPAGLAADDTHVVWGSTHDMRTFSNDDQPPNTCTIQGRAHADAATELRLVASNAFSCLDVALDGNHVYFTVVKHVAGVSDNFVRNIGIGRVDIATKQIETLEIGIEGPEAGPRHVFVDGDGLLLVSPFVIARIKKNALDGKRDIAL